MSTLRILVILFSVFVAGWAACGPENGPAIHDEDTDTGTDDLETDIAPDRDPPLVDRFP